MLSFNNHLVQADRQCGRFGEYSLRDEYSVAGKDRHVNMLTEDCVMTVMTEVHRHA